MKKSKKELKKATAFQLTTNRIVAAMVLVNFLNAPGNQKTPDDHYNNEIIDYTGKDDDSFDIYWYGNISKKISVNEKSTYTRIK